MNSHATFILILAVLLAACEGGDTEREVDALEDTTTQTTSPDAMTERPDTTGDATWAYLQEEEYAQAWDFWPDKEPFYEGTEPHGALLNTYLNEPAAEAVANGSADFADGSILVKENYMPDSSLAAVTVMHKVADYNPEHGDWFWAKYGPDGTVQAEGKVESCQSCHSGEDDGNYIMTGDL